MQLHPSRFLSASALCLTLVWAAAAGAQRRNDPPQRHVEGMRRATAAETQLKSAFEQSGALSRSIAAPITSLMDILNRDAGRLHRVDQLRQDYQLSGAQVLTGVYEIGGKVVTQHEAFGTRASQRDRQPPSSFLRHATHVSGTIAADPPDDAAAPHKRLALGMAPGAQIHAYVGEDHMAEITGADPAMSASNHSYGPAAGWWEDDDLSECRGAAGKPANQPIQPCWVWSGDSSARESLWFGKYTQASHAFDRAIRAAPARSVFVAAGNDREDNAGGAGWNGWHVNNGRWTNRTRNADGFDAGYDTILAGQASAKNVITIGSIDDVSSGGLQPRNVRVSFFSGWGPTDDGRIKPDLVTNGNTLYSATFRTLANGQPDPAAYQEMLGTSMATPVATGIATLLNELAVRERRRPLFADEMKALLIHTAVNSAPGPSFSTGWGAIDALAAGRILAGDTARSRLLRFHAPVYPLTLDMTAAAGEDIKVTLVWLDPEATANPGRLDEPAATLVHDLDLSLRSPSQVEHGPWMLDPADRAKAPVQCKAHLGVATHCPANRRDPVEQVEVDAGEVEVGTWTIRVQAPAGIAGQSFALVVTGLEQVEPSAKEK
jgi:hypothetical protein